MEAILLYFAESVRQVACGVCLVRLLHTALTVSFASPRVRASVDCFARVVAALFSTTRYLNCVSRKNPSVRGGDARGAVIDLARLRAVAATSPDIS